MQRLLLSFNISVSAFKMHPLFQIRFTDLLLNLLVLMGLFTLDLVALMQGKLFHLSTWQWITQLQSSACSSCERQAFSSSISLSREAWEQPPCLASLGAAEEQTGLWHHLPQLTSCHGRIFLDLPLQGHQHLLCDLPGPKTALFSGGDVLVPCLMWPSKQPKHGWWWFCQVSALKQ